MELSRLGKAAGIIVELRSLFKASGRRAPGTVALPYMG